MTLEEKLAVDYDIILEEKRKRNNIISYHWLKVNIAKTEIYRHEFFYSTPEFCNEFTASHRHRTLSTLWNWIKNEDTKDICWTRVYSTMPDDVLESLKFLIAVESL